MGELTNVLLVLSTGIISLLAFYFGSIVGKGENLTEQEIKITNPIKVHKEYREKEEIKEAIKKEQEKNEIIMQNIDNYDGTENGQRDLPQ